MLFSKAFREFEEKNTGQDQTLTQDRPQSTHNIFARQSDIDVKGTTDAAFLERLSDPLWRLENLYWIENKKGKEVKFKLNIFQRFLVKNLHFRNIILKARQLGMSTFIAMFFLDQILFNRNKKAAIVADKIDSGRNIFAKIKFAWDKFDPDLKDKLSLDCVTDQAGLFKFSNESEIRVGTTIHSGTYQYLHISELGPLCKESPEKAETVIKSAFPTVADEPNTFVFIESTAEGENNEFHIRCLDAMRRLSEAESQTPEDANASLLPFEYRFFFFPWWQNPEYEYSDDIAKRVKLRRSTIVYFEELEKLLKMTFSLGKKAWYEMKHQELKGRMAEQHPSYPEEAFLSSGNKMFDPTILSKKLASDVLEPLQIVNNLTVFVPWKQKHRYAIGGDVGSGMGQDHSAAVVIDFTINRVVATYRSNTVDPVAFAYELAMIGNMYGGCLIAPEANFMGHTTAVTLKGIYPYIYHYEIKGYEETKETMRVGWLTNVSTKPRMMYELKQAFEDEINPLLVSDPTILHEAIAYSKDDLTITEKEAQKLTRHFDLLTACAIAWQMKDHAQIVSALSNPKVERRIAERRERNRSSK